MIARVPRISAIQTRYLPHHIFGGRAVLPAGAICPSAMILFQNNFLDALRIDMDAATKDRLFQKGLDAFNSARFYDAHEKWEEVWLKTPNPEKMFLQGLIQVAAAYHHYLRANVRGARWLLREGAAKLKPFPEVHRGIELGRLRDVARWWLVALDGGARPGKDKIPVIEISGRR
jgi:hypothetical protein